MPRADGFNVVCEEEPEVAKSAGNLIETPVGPAHQLSITLGGDLNITQQRDLESIPAVRCLCS